MKLNIISFLIWLIIIVILFFYTCTHLKYVQSTNLPKHDPRVSSLALFFDHYHCPASFYIKDFLQIGDKYNLDYRLLPAISIQESTCFKHGLYNNYFGIGSASALEHYNSPAEGIERAAQMIIKYGLNRYGPSGNKNYPKEIEAIMKKI